MPRRYVAGVGWVGQDDGPAESTSQSSAGSGGGTNATTNSAPLTSQTQTVSNNNSSEYSADNPPNFSTDKAGWVRYYYGEEYLQDGKYPPGILIDFGGDDKMRITGYRTTPETHPWLYPGPGDVHTNGKIYPEISRENYYDATTGKFRQGFKATPEQIQANHDKRNYYRNGGSGTDPAIIRTMVDNRRPDSPYWARHEANRRAIGKPGVTRMPYLHPEEVSGPYGTYTYMKQNLGMGPGGRPYKIGMLDSVYTSNGNPYVPPGQTPPDTGGGDDITVPVPDTGDGQLIDEGGSQPPPDTGGGGGGDNVTQPIGPLSTGTGTTMGTTSAGGGVDPVAMIQSGGGGMLSSAAGNQRPQGGMLAQAKPAPGMQPPPVPTASQTPAPLAPRAHIKPVSGEFGA